MQFTIYFNANNLFPFRNQVEWRQWTQIKKIVEKDEKSFWKPITQSVDTERRKIPFSIAGGISLQVSLLHF